LTLVGRGIDQGGWTSLVAPMELVATSPERDDSGAVTSDSTVRAGDLRYVGFASTAPQLAAAGGDPAGGSIGIGIASHGEWTNLGTRMLPVVDTDVDGDGDAEFQTFVTKFSRDVDLTTAQTFDAATERLVEVVPVNGTFGDVDTTVFDNNVVVIPISLRALGLTPGKTATFTVSTRSPDFAPDASGIVDQVEPFTVDPYAPRYWFDGGTPDAFLFRAAPGDPLAVHRTTGPAGEEPPLLVLHTHNPTPGARAQVVEVLAPVPVGATASGVPGALTGR
jgi:hypothetical protein